MNDEEVVQPEIIDEVNNNKINPHNNNVKEDKPKISVARLSSMVGCISLFVVIITYVILGSVLGNSAWSTAWPMFFLPGILPSVVEAKHHKRIAILNFPFLILMIYLFMGMIGNLYAINLWHPYWVLFFLIPIFYSIAGVIDAKRK